MTSIKLIVKGANARAVVDGPLTSGAVGIPVTITYDSGWDGLTKALICRSEEDARTILDVEDTATVAHEVMKPDRILYIGVEGRNADGTLVIPTVWARCGHIQPGATSDADPSLDPRLPVWQQLQEQIGDLDDLDTEDKSTLVAAINEALTKGGGEADPEEITKIVNEYLAANPPEDGADGRGVASIARTSGDGSAGTVDTYTITYTDETTSTFQVRNGSDGQDGADGKDGNDGKDGADGKTPYIGENGNWWIGDTDTGITAGGKNGEDGTKIYIGPDQPTDGTLYWLDTSESGGSGGETVTYSITAALTNVTIDNTAESANEGESFAATLSVSVGYELSSVKITMGGADITNTAYASGNIYISAVTGDVVITAVAVEISEEVTTYTITNNLVNVTSNNSAVSAEENASYTATLTADDGYTLEGAAVTITMGGVNITTEVYADGVVAIPAVTGDVVISVIGAEYIGEPVSMTYSAGLRGFSSYYSDDGLTLMEKTPRDRGGFYSTVFEVDTKITASFVVADYQNACYGYGLWGYLDGTSRFYGGVYCASGKHEITITVPAGNRFLIMGTYESQCTNIVVNGKEV